MPRRLALFPLVLATVSASSILSTTTSVAGAIEAELCFGQVPTIVGSPGESIEGTDGPDVVVTNGAYRGLGTGDGDDLVCVTGAVDDGGYSDAVILDTGQGDDRVDTTSAVKGSTYDVILLGAGADEFVGGSVPDLVQTGEYPDFDTDVDVVMTGGGPDMVLSNGPDAVDLGRGADALYLQGLPGSATLLKGGGGDNRLGFDLVSIKEPHDWVVDNRSQQLLEDGQLALNWNGFTRFGVAALGSVLFVGSDDDESLEFRREAGQHAPYWHAQKDALDVRMHGGDDVVFFYGGADGSRFNGGEGTDELRYERHSIIGISRADVVFDLKGGLLRDIGRENIIDRRATNFENAKVFNPFGLTTLKGTAGPNTLSTYWDPYTSSSGTFYGRAGDDRLLGSDRDDVLIGGSGDDAAKGRHGDDRCKAESKLGCET